MLQLKLAQFVPQLLVILVTISCCGCVPQTSTQRQQWLLRGSSEQYADFMNSMVATEYTASTFEQLWSANVNAWQDGVEFCKQESAFNPQVETWLSTIKQLMETTHINKHSLPVQNETQPVFSAFKRDFQCHGQQHSLTSWIEPLAFALRHPKGVCADPSGSLLSRDYLLLTSITEVQQLACGRPSRKFYFDLGASTWAAGAGGPSQEWFIEAYAKRGIKFDRMLMWEAGPRSSSDIFTGVPLELHHAYQYMNIPASPDKNSPANPLNILKKITQPHDFVVLKIDIDNNPVEMELVKQLLNDEEIYSRVDEFFFEHHVKFEPMFAVGWVPEQSSQTEMLKDSYALFRELREKGIRAHGWP